jgi:hypothetical protein
VPNITIKDVPDALHAQLEREAAANFRSVDQEIMARIQHSFDLDERLNAKTVDQLIQEAIDSGPEELLTREKFDAARNQARGTFAGKNRAA